MFGLFAKKPLEELGAPVAGKVIKSSEIPDDTFAQEMLGKGLAIEPTEGKLYAPCDGELSMIFDTKHAVSFTSKQGAEILVHVGLDTVMLKGEYFTVHVSDGIEVKKGDLILEFDMQKIQEAGYRLVTPVVICNTSEFKSVEPQAVGELVKPTDTVLKIF